VVGDQPLVASDDPGEVADAGRVARVEGKGDGEAGRVAEGLGGDGALLQLRGRRDGGAETLGLR
jgi:hypothetical protein